MPEEHNKVYNACFTIVVNVSFEDNGIDEVEDQAYEELASRGGYNAPCCIDLDFIEETD